MYFDNSSSVLITVVFFFFFSSRRRHTRFDCDWSSDVCSSDLSTCAGSTTASPLDPKQPHYSAKAKSCIFLFMYGGPSQVDLWDPKPELVKIGRASCRERV